MPIPIKVTKAQIDRLDVDDLEKFVARRYSEMSEAAQSVLGDPIGVLGSRGQEGLGGLALEFGRGLASKPTLPGAGPSGQFGNIIGQSALPVAGSIALASLGGGPLAFGAKALSKTPLAGAAGRGLASAARISLKYAPKAARAIKFAVPTLPMVDAALKTAGGAAIGETANAVTSALKGGDFPTKRADAARKIFETAALAGETDLVAAKGLSLLGQAVVNVLPTIINTFTRVSASAAKEGMLHAEKLKVFGNRANEEMRGAEIVKRLQQQAEAARVYFGKKVEETGSALNARFSGARVVDTQNAGQTLRNDFLKTRSGPLTGAAVDPRNGRALAPLKKDGDADFIAGLIRRVNAFPKISVEDAIKELRNIRNAITFREGMVPAVQNEPYQRILKKFAAGLNDSLERTARSGGDDMFLKANKDFSEFAELYDNQLSPMLKTDTVGDKAAVDKFLKLKAAFDSGGAREMMLRRLAFQIPGGKKTIQDLVDQIVRVSFLGIPIPTVSGAVLNAIRLLAAPRLMAGSFKTGGGLARFAPRVASGIAITVRDPSGGERVIDSSDLPNAIKSGARFVGRAALGGAEAVKEVGRGLSSPK